MYTRGVSAVSVIIPAYRVTEYIADTLDSVLAQTFRDFEIIVVNDGCPDSEALERVLAPYLDRIRYIRLDKNAGPSATRNAGIRAAKSDLIAFLDGDDLFNPDFLEVQVAYLNRNAEADMVFGSLLLFGDDPCAGMPLSQFRPLHGPVTLTSILTEKVTVPLMSLVRRESLFRAGLFDDAIRKCEDFDLWLRLLKSGGRIIYHDQVVGKYRVRGSSASADATDMIRYRMIVLDKMEREMALTPDELQALQDARLRWAAESDLARSKQLFAAGNYREAAEHVRKANRYYRLTKYTFASALLGSAPRLVRAAVDCRDAIQRSTRRKALR